MLASSAGTLPIGEEWTYEVKWDGYRTLAVKQGQRVKLVSRNLKDATALYPSAARAVAQVHGDAVLLDGGSSAYIPTGIHRFRRYTMGRLTRSSIMRSTFST